MVQSISDARCSSNSTSLAGLCSRNSRFSPLGAQGEIDNAECRNPQFPSIEPLRVEKNVDRTMKGAPLAPSGRSPSRIPRGCIFACQYPRFLSLSPNPILAPLQFGNRADRAVLAILARRVIVIRGRSDAVWPQCNAHWEHTCGLGNYE